MRRKPDDHRVFPPFNWDNHFSRLSEAEARRHPFLPRAHPRFSDAEVSSELSRWMLPERLERLERSCRERFHSLTLVLDGLWDPYNLSAIARSAEAFGLVRIHNLPQARDSIVSAKVSRGTLRWLDIYEHESASLLVERLQTQGYQLVATHPQGELLPEDLSQLARPALVLGNEHDGISPELTQACTHRVQVPMLGFAESLNVSVTAGILLHEARRSRQGDLSEEERSNLLARWLIRALPRAEELLASSEETSAPPLLT